MSENDKEEPEPTGDPIEEKPKPKSNIEKYNEKVKTEGIKPEVPKEVVKLQKQLFDTLFATASEEAKAYAGVFKKKGDFDSAILILQEQAKMKQPAPNTSSLPLPTGIPKIGLSKYMVHRPGSEKIEWNIPASVIMDPKKNKQLGEY